jgi:Domain of unknown function (DUF4340)
MSAARSRVWLIWAILAALIAVIVALQMRGHSAAPEVHETHDDAPRMLFPMSIEAEVWALEIFEKGVLHRFERDAKGLWFYHAHGAPKANDATHAHQTDPKQAEFIANALDGLGRTRREREFEKSNSAEYGLNAPEMFVLLYAKDTAQLLDKITVGSMAPDGLSRYVSSNNYPKVVSIANYQVENLQNLLESVGAKTQPTKN